MSLPQTWTSYTLHPGNAMLLYQDLTPCMTWWIEPSEGSCLEHVEVLQQAVQVICLPQRQEARAIDTLRITAAS